MAVVCVLSVYFRNDVDPLETPYTGSRLGLIRVHPLERVCCLLVLSLVSSTLPCIRQPRLRPRVLGICGFVLVCTQAFMGFLAYERLVN